jgi:hypothetical protein
VGVGPVWPLDTLTNASPDVENRVILSSSERTRSVPASRWGLNPAVEREAVIGISHARPSAGLCGPGSASEDARE